jgi:tetratricopeptide (TPR) repeat protein
VFYNESKRFAETIDEVQKGKNTFFTIDIIGNPLELYSGVAYKELKNYDAAIREFKTAAAYNPYNNRTYNNWATVYWDLKEYRTAIDNYKKALAYAPEFETILKNLAMTYYYSGDYTACIETIEKLKIEKDPLLINVLNECRRKLAEKK